MVGLIIAFVLICFPAIGDSDFNQGGIFNKSTLFCDDVGNCYKAKQVIFSGGTVVDNGDGTITVTIGTVIPPENNIYNTDGQQIYNTNGDPIFHT